jgi:hypothetical protein
MLSACCFLHCIALTPPALYLLISAHICAYMQDREEHELEEQAQAENTSTDPEQGKPRCI